MQLVSRLWSKFVKSATAGDTVLNQDFKEFIRLLNDNHVRYLVVGGYAVALHGHKASGRFQDLADLENLE